MAENTEVWREKGTFAVVNRRGEILLYDAILFCPTVEEPWGNTIEKIKPGYWPFADPSKGCIGARIHRDVVHYTAYVEGKNDMIPVEVYTAAVIFYNKTGRKDYMDLFVFPDHRVLPRGGIPLTLPHILYKKEDEKLLGGCFVPLHEDDGVMENGPLPVPVKKVVKKKDLVNAIHKEIEGDTEVAAQPGTNELFDNFNVETFSSSILMSLYMLYYIAALAFLTEVGDAQTYYACIMLLLGGQWAYVVHNIYEEKREKFFQGGEKKIGETVAVVDS